MNRKRVILCLVAATFYSYSTESLAQEPISSLDQTPTGFMIEGILSASIFATQDGATIFNAAAVPNAVIGYKARRIAIGLGIGFHRSGTTLKDSTSDMTQRGSITAMLLAPRLEISIFQSTMGMAEAYIVASFGAGFNVYRSRFEGGGFESSDTDSGPVLGGHAGLGGRFFLGGGPFALGVEFGWSGLFMNLGDNEAQENIWYKIHGIYGAIAGTFVFG